MLPVANHHGLQKELVSVMLLLVPACLGGRPPHPESLQPPDPSHMRGAASRQILRA